MRRGRLVLLAALLGGAGILWVVTEAARQRAADAAWEATVAEATRTLQDPDTAVVRAMFDAGLNPALPTFGVQRLRELAPDLVYTVALRDPDMLADPQRFRVALAELIRSGAAGGRIFGGWTPEQLRALAQRARTANRTGDPGGAALAQLPEDDAASVLIYVMGRYGANRTMKPILARTAQPLCIQFRSTVERERPGVYANCFEYLVDRAP